jgi:DNA uptake protein ComE-like DNA-binding protein
MKKPLRQLLKEYFYFPKKDRNGIIVLGILMVAVLAGYIAVDNIRLKPGGDYSDFKSALETWEHEEEIETGFRKLFVFNPNSISPEKLDSLSLPVFVKKNILRYRSSGGKFNNTSDFRKIYGMNDSIFTAIEKYIKIPETQSKQVEIIPQRKELFTGTFDPNRAEAEVLHEFGFNSYQSSNLLKYRESGGFFDHPTDLMKIYGIDSVFFSIIEENIKIDEQGIQIDDERSGTRRKESIKNTLKVELNTADSIQLMKMNGIGKVFAGRILKYRELLGGFYEKEQLLEVYNLSGETYHRIRDNIWVDTLRVKKVRVNFAGYPELLRHPYIKKRHVQAILDYREENGPFHSLNQVLQAGLIDSVTFCSLKPYLSAR